MGVLQKGKNQRFGRYARIAITNFWSLREAMLAGAGIAILPSFCIVEDLLDGSVVQLFPDVSFERSIIRSQYPHYKNIPKKVRAFTDFLKKRFDGNLVITKRKR